MRERAYKAGIGVAVCDPRAATCF